MPTFGQTEAGTWHLVGPDGCRYGRAFADNTDRSPANIVMSSNIVAYDLPDTPTATQSSSISGSLSQPSSHSGRFGPRGRTDDQRLVLSTQLQENDSPLCESCRPQLNRHQQRRSRVITNRPHRVAISTGRSLTTTASRPVTDVGATNPPPGTMTFSTRYPLDYQSVFIDSCVGYSLASSGGRSPCSSRRAMSRTNKRTCRTRSSRSLYA
jgi:ribosomal protein L37AE/L43A